jgi:beta-phosphoglucomutase
VNASPRRGFDALLFDLDGTLIDSMPLHARAWVQWGATVGRPLSDDPAHFASTAGRSGPEILADMFPGATPAEIERMADAREQVYRAMARQELQLVAGAQALLQRAHAAGKRLAVCTAAPPDNIALAFERFGLAEWVAVVSSPADGLRGKPHPDIFLAAAERLSVPPEACLVFEDAPLGLEAAHRAGMAAVALTTTLDAAAFSAYPNRIATVSDFTALDPALLFH